MSALETLIAKRDALAPEVAELEDAVNALGATKGGKDQPGFAILSRNLEDMKAELAALNAKISAEEKAAAVAQFATPIIEAFGTVNVNNSANLPNSIHINDIDTFLKKEQDAAARAQDRILVLTLIKDAMATVEIDPEVRDNLRPLHIVADGEKAVKLAVSTRGAVGKRSAPGASTRGRQLITAANDDFAHVVGKIVGKDGDYASFRELLRVEVPDDFARLEAGKANNSNYSANVQAQRLMGVRTEPIEAAV